MKITNSYRYLTKNTQIQRPLEFNLTNCLLFLTNMTNFNRETDRVEGKILWSPKVVALGRFQSLTLANHVSGVIAVIAMRWHYRNMRVASRDDLFNHAKKTRMSSEIFGSVGFAWASTRLSTFPLPTTSDLCPIPLAFFWVSAKGLVATKTQAFHWFQA